MKSITGVLSPNWSDPWIFLSLDGWFPQYFCNFQFSLRACSKVQRLLIDFPRFGSGPCEEERHLLRHPPQFQQRQVSAARQPPLAPRGALAEITAFPPVGGKAARDSRVKKCYYLNIAETGSLTITQLLQSQFSHLEMVTCQKRGGGGKKRHCEGERVLKNEEFHSMLKSILHEGYSFNVEQHSCLSGFVHQRRTY